MAAQSTDQTRTRIEVTQAVIDALFAASNAWHPREACGLLLGEGARITRFAPTVNVHPEPRARFEIDPQALIDAHRAARTDGPQVLGYFHSHPGGRAYPSPTDRADAAHDGRIWSIVAGREIGFWRDWPDGFAPLSYALVDE